MTMRKLMFPCEKKFMPLAIAINGEAFSGPLYNKGMAWDCPIHETFWRGPETYGVGEGEGGFRHFLKLF